jgi:hypothetical protein
MSSSRFLQSFIITLVCHFSTFAALPVERAGLSRRDYAHHNLVDIKKLSKRPDESVKPEKFILKTVEATIASPRTEVDSNALGQPKVALSTDKPSISGHVNLSIPAQPLWSNSSGQPTLIDKTYLDAYAILRENNSCSRFFGGPRVATVVLNSLYPKLETSLIENHVGISMSGSITMVTDFQTGASYRLFKRAFVNLTGPFYRSANSKSQGFFHKIGYYLANTREARVTMLLHELGHLLRGSDGLWLLPDDGDSHVQVAANTATIMNKCSEQIKALSMESVP